MKQAAAVAAQLVDVRNIASHKCVRLTIDVPAEHALRVIEAFGWPTMVDPVPVAVARLNPGKEVVQHGSAQAELDKAQPRQALPQLGGARPGRDWAQLVPSEQAGILCAERPFWKFLREEYDYEARNSDEAAAAVRALCGVTSRKDIAADHRARVLWFGIVTRYRTWQREPEVVA